MPRLAVLPLLVALVLTVLPACRPSKAEVAQMQATLAQVQADQAALRERLDAVAFHEAGADESGHIEREGLRTALSELTEALSELTERVRELETKRRPTPSQPRPDPAVTYKVEIGDAPFKGPADALITIVSWTDFQCPYCARVQPTLRDLMGRAEYENEIRVVHMHNPLAFHPRAMPAALASEAAREQGKFWEMHDLLFANQKDLTDENFRKWAKKLRLDVRRFERDMKDPDLKARIEQQQARGAVLGARGTPAFFINGRFLSGAQPVDSFRALIDEELPKTHELLRNGTPRRSVYEATIRRGKTEA